MSDAQFEFYEAKDGWRWRLKAGNNKIVADSGEAYANEEDAMDGAAIFYDASSKLSKDEA